MAAPVVVRQRTVPAFRKEDWPETPEIIARIYAARGVLSLKDISTKLTDLISPSLLGGIDRAAELLGQAIMNSKFIMIAGDYDCDGATGTATAYRGLRLLGCERLDFSIPNRFKHGYGLSPELIADMTPTPDLVVTVDSGVASNAGVAAAKARGITVVITDHHLQGATLPDADAIVNPNVNGDPFPSKALAGVGVMFYTLMATQKYLRKARWFGPNRPEPNLTSLLDLVAVGTIADLVPLDANNRLIVSAGLARIRRGETTRGLQALIANSKCDLTRLTSTDIAFNIGPRINAAGRLEDMRVGVLTLVSEDPVLAPLYANQLEEINNARKERQQEMIADAEKILSSAKGQGKGAGVVLFDATWHSGIVGLVASKVKESLYRPVIALAPSEPGSKELRGSARSIPGFHLRDALAIVDVRHPGMMPKFGGHAMAAGLSLHADRVEEFSAAFDKVASELLTEDMLNAELLTDGALTAEELSVEFADYLNQWGPWGQGFPAPIFENEFLVLDHRVLGQQQNHLKLVLQLAGQDWTIDGIHFFGFTGQDIPSRVKAVYELSINEFRGNRNPQLIIRNLVPLE